MTKIIIREVGPYTITFEAGDYLRCNGRSTVVSMLREPRSINGRTIVATVDTLCLGANGKTDHVSLSQDEYDLIRAESARYSAERQARYARENAAEIAAQAVADRAARSYARNVNEGGEGYNPYRDGGFGGDRGQDY